MGKTAVKGLFNSCLIAATVLLAAITVAAGFSGRISPLDSGILPLLGLALPFLLLANLGVALCWGLARKYWAFIPLLAIGLNWNYLTAVFQFRSDAEKSLAEQYLTLATYNVHSFGYEITGYSCKEIARYMEEEEVDVLCFQEFSDNQYFPMDSIRKVLAHWPYAYIPKEEAEMDALPIALFSRYPLAGQRFITYPESANCSLLCDVIVGSDTVRVLNNHLQTTNISQKRSTWQRELATNNTRREAYAAKDAAETLHKNFVKRTHQTYVIGEFAKNSPYPVLVCGDLNSIPSSHTYYYLQQFLKDGFRTAGHGYMYTFRHARKLLRIDYIFHSPQLEGIRYYSPDLDLSSDHNPVIMRVGIK